MSGIIFGILSAFFWATSDVVSRILSDKMDNTLWTALFSIWMLAIASITLVIMMMYGWSEKLLVENKLHILWMIFAWVINGIGFIFFFKFFSLGGNFTQWLPIILICVLLFALLYWIIFFKDTMNIKIMLGIIFAAISIYLLSGK